MPGLGIITRLREVKLQEYWKEVSEMSLETNYVHEEDGKYYDNLKGVNGMDYTKTESGKWFYSSGAVWADENEKIGIAQRISDSPVGPWQKDINLRLCAKAPEMYEVLKALADWPLHSKCFDGYKAKNSAESLANARRIARTLVESIERK
jgi:hypothetical protein